jgi:RND family efflux transporter MFP subunit
MRLGRLAACLVVGSFLAGCRREAASGEDKGPPPAPVKWEAIKQASPEEWTEVVGTTLPLPDHAARITAPVEGRVLALLQSAAGKAIAEGQPVAAGDVIVRLDDTILRVTRDKALSAKKVLQAEKEAAEFAVKQAEMEVRRLNDLRRQQGGTPLVAPIELEKATVTLEAARASARADVVKLAAADEEIASIDRQLKLYELTAPRKGRLGRLQVVVGQTLAAGAGVADLIDVEDEIDVLCFVPASDARKLQVGQPARTGADEHATEGKVEFIAEQAEVDTGLIAVKLRFPNRYLKLPAKCVTRLRVLTQPAKTCWTIPEASLMEDQEPPAVMIVEDVESKSEHGHTEQTGKARRLQAVVGMRDRIRGKMEIVSLQDPDKIWHGEVSKALVVTEQGQGLQTGDAVKLEVEEEPKKD